MNYIEFIETSVFSRQREALLTEDEYRVFQEMLIINPLEGDFRVQAVAGRSASHLKAITKAKAVGFGVFTIFKMAKGVSGFSWLILKAGETT